MIDEESESDDGKSQAGASQLRNIFEQAILATQAVAAVLLLQRLRQHVRGRAGGRTGPREDCEFALFGRKAEFSQCGNGCRRTAIILIALPADSVAVNIRSQ